MSQYSDKEIVAALLRKDTAITREFLYRRCFPLFASIYNRYYTDCESCFELINEIYIFILYPNKQTGRSKLQDFGFRCTLTMWLKIVTENYCRQLFAKRMDKTENISVEDDRTQWESHSLETDFNSLNMEDVRKVLRMMPNERYRKLIEYRYLDEKTNEETAMLLTLTMANYYNVHLRAKAQFCSALRKEGLI